MARHPQTFPHGLHPSSLEPGATDMQYPPTTLFPRPPPGEEESHEKENPLQQVVHLRNTTQTMTTLVADLSQSLWAKASDQERYVGKLTIEPKPKVVLVDIIITSYTPAFLLTIRQLARVDHNN